MGSRFHYAVGFAKGSRHHVFVPLGVRVAYYRCGVSRRLQPRFSLVCLPLRNVLENVDQHFRLGQT